MALSITHSYVSAIPDAGDASLVQPSDWNDVHDISGLAAGIEDFLATPSSANLKTAVTDETGSGALVFANTPTLVTPVLGVATGSTLTLTQGTITDPATMISGTVTWNDAADTFTAIKLNVTNTNSATGSILMDLQVDTVSKFKFLRRGYDADTPALSTAGQMSIGAANENLFFGGSTASNAHGVVNSALLAIRSGSYLGWSSSSSDANTASDVKLFRDAAATLALRNSTTAQTFRVYNTESSSLTNYERGVFDWSTTANVLTVGTQQGGTGTARVMRFISNGNEMMRTKTDGSWDIGSSAFSGFAIYNGSTILLYANTSNVVQTSTHAPRTDATYDLGTTPTGGFSGGWLNLYLSSAAKIAWNNDLFLTRSAAATLRHGAADAAAPVAQTVVVQSVVAGTADTAGTNWTMAGSKSTGTGVPGDIIFQTAGKGAASTTQNTLITALTIKGGTTNNTNVGYPSVVVGAGAALATNATDGFLYVPSCAGTPTGTPTAITGGIPIVVDSTNNKLYFYSSAAWRDAGP
jgi:hypothetical protein